MVKCPDVSYEDDDELEPVQPKTRSLKKRSDKAIANAARLSVSKKATSWSRVSSQKKKRKSKPRVVEAKEVTSDYCDEDDQPSLCSQGLLTPLDSGLTSTVADFIRHKVALVAKGFPPVALIPPRAPSLSWPLKPIIKVNNGSFLKDTHPLWKCHSSYEAIYSSSGLNPAEALIREPVRNLVNLDIVAPCSSLNPCLLDRLSCNDNVGIPCFI
jgi:hypothetical protein